MGPGAGRRDGGCPRLCRRSVRQETHGAPCVRPSPGPEPLGGMASWTFRTCAAMWMWGGEWGAKVRCGPATGLQPRPPSHGLHRLLRSIGVCVASECPAAPQPPGPGLRGMGGGGGSLVPLRPGAAQHAPGTRVRTQLGIPRPLSVWGTGVGRRAPPSTRGPQAARQPRALGRRLANAQCPTPPPPPQRPPPTQRAQATALLMISVSLSVLVPNISCRSSPFR